MLPNMKETKGTHCGLFGMVQVKNFGYSKPEGGWCPNCIHENTAFCNKSGNCLAQKGHAPTGYTPIKSK